MIEFTDRQQRTIASGLTILALTVTFAFVAFIVYGAVRLLAFAANAVVPVVLGLFLALFFKPYYHWWLRVVRNPTLALVVMLLTVFVPAIALIAYAGSAIVEEISNLIDQGPALVVQVQHWFEATFPRLQTLLGRFGIRYGQLGDLFAQFGSRAFAVGSLGALKCLTTLLTALVTLVFFVCFLTTRERRGSDIVAELPFLKPETRDFVATEIDVFIEIVVSFFQRQTVICLIEGCLYGAGFWAVGLEYGFLVGFALGVMNLIPLFGSVMCLPLALPLAYFGPGGSSTRLAAVIAVWLTGQLLDGYLITPRIQGDKTGLGYAGVIFSFFFWAIVLGPVLGMLLAIPLSAFCVVLWRAIKVKYIRPVV